MEEKRKLQRRYIMFYSRVFDRTTGEFLGHLENITSEGGMIISEGPLEIDQVYSLAMRLPEDVYQKLAINFEAQSIWCKPDIDPAFYNTGFKFQKLAEEDIAIIHQIVDDYIFRD